MPSITETTQTIDGIDLHTLVAGSGPPIVLIHGYAQTSHMWRPLMEVLSRRHLVLAPDLRGAGGSSKPAAGGYEKAALAREVRGLVRSFTDAPVRVVGHDIGMMVAYAYAAQFTSEVERLVLMEAFLPGIGAADQVWLLRDNWHFHFRGEIPERLVAGREGIYFEHFWDGFAADPKHTVGAADRKVYVVAYSQPGAMHAGFEYFHAFEQDRKDFAGFARTKLPMPVLAVSGERASGQFFLDQARMVATNVRTVLVPNVGHWLMEEATSEMIPLLTSFLDAPPPVAQPHAR